MGSLKVSRRDQDGISILELQGEADADSVQNLAQQLKKLSKEGRGKIVLNLANLKYVSSAALGLLTVTIADVRKRRGEIKLSAVPSQVYTVFDLLGFPLLIEMYQDEESAINSFKPESQEPTLLEHQIVNALENPNYDWRTIEGIARECNLRPETVREVLTKLEDKVIQSSIPDPKGRALFTTRRHYKQRQNIFNKILSALTDRIR